VLDGLEEVKLCVGYTLDGKQIDYLPASIGAQQRLEPIYETMSGWRESTYGVQRWEDLPALAKAYVQRVEELSAVPVALLSTSPEREHTITRQDPFA